MQEFDKSLIWFRRDLRSFDHAALHHALKRSRSVYCAFIFDNDILGSLPRQDKRVGFIHASIVELDAELRRLGGFLIVRHGPAAQEIVRLADELQVDAVFANHDYEPTAVARDADVATALAYMGKALLTYKDQVVFEKDEVLSLSAKPFSVFTPYKNAWLKKLQAADDDFFLKAYPVEAYASRLAAPDGHAETGIPSLTELGFDPVDLAQFGIPPGMSGGEELFAEFRDKLGDYDEARNFPAVQGTSYLSVHLRFGTVSIRGLARQAIDAMRQPVTGTGAATWLAELVWRDFYFMILHHHPRVAERSFKPEYDAIRWEDGEDGEALFAAWCEGRTGYPLVDAAMHQLNQTGFMHNRLRMVTACFLIKDLGIDWRRGERYFARQLNDYDLAANNGGWQWASSSGCDAQPYFRIFNPITQSKKFDAQGKFIRRYLPRLSDLPDKWIHAPWLAPADVLREAGLVLGIDYPFPLVQHDEARLRTLQRYAVVKKVKPETVPEDD